MLRLAKEIGLVRSDRIDEVLPLVRVRRCEEVLAVLLHRIQSQLADPAKQPALNHRQLGLWHLDAEFARYKLRESCEGLRGKLTNFGGIRCRHISSPGGSLRRIPALRSALLF